MTPTTQKHLDAIRAGTVTKSNVIGIRKILNHAGRLRAGWSGNNLNATPADADAIERALASHTPLVIHELHSTGYAVLCSPRWRKRFNERQRLIIEHLRCFRLVRFDRIGARGDHVVPVYRAVGPGGDCFHFRNIPWQSALYNGEESGPVIVEGNRE